MTEDPKKAGRPSKLTPHVQAEILKVLTTGCARETAAASVGVWGCTLREWLRRGARARQLGRPKPSEAKYLAFLQAVEEVEAQQEVRDVAIVRKAGEDVFTDVTIETTLPDGSVEKRTEKKLVRGGDYRAKTWYLERRGSRRWGYKANLVVEMKGEAKAVFDIARKYIPEAEYERFLSEVAAAGSDESANEDTGEESE